MCKIASLLLAALALAGSASARTFTNTEGKTVEAEIVRVVGEDKVMLRLENRRSVTIEIATLSAEDRQYIPEWQATRIPNLRFEPRMVRKTDVEKFKGSSYTYASTPQLEEAIYLVLDLKAGDLTNEAFQKIKPVRSGGDSGEDDGPIIVR
jgi:hypothetical protein